MGGKEGKRERVGGMRKEGTGRRMEMKRRGETVGDFSSHDLRLDKQRDLTGPHCPDGGLFSGRQFTEESAGRTD